MPYCSFQGYCAPARSYVSSTALVLLWSTPLLTLADPSVPPTMLHIGGHHAEEAKRYADAGFANRVVFVEAMPKAHIVCARVAASYGQECINALLWDTDGSELSFHVTTDHAGNAWSSSVFELTAANERWAEHQRPRPFGQLHLPTNRLDTLTARHPALRRNFTHIVLDVQGAELQVLRGMGELLRQLPLQSAIIESSGTELYAGQALQAEVVRFMSAAGFRCVKDCACEFHCDAVFIPSIVSSADGQSPARDARVEPASSAPLLGHARCVSEACAAKQRLRGAATEIGNPTLHVGAPGKASPGKAPVGASAAESRRHSACDASTCAIVSVFTAGVADEWRNLHITLQRVKLESLVVAFALDEEAQTVAQAAGVAVRTNLLSASLSRASDYGMAAFQPIVMLKLLALQEVLREGKLVFFLDTVSRQSHLLTQHVTFSRFSSADVRAGCCRHARLCRRLLQPATA